jgi:hypothetical protein
MWPSLGILALAVLARPAGGRAHAVARRKVGRARTVIVGLPRANVLLARTRAVLQLFPAVQDGECCLAEFGPLRTRLDESLLLERTDYLE